MTTATPTTAARPQTEDEILGDLAPEKSKTVYTKAGNALQITNPFLEFAKI
jgi:hypothetical protein